MKGDGSNKKSPSKAGERGNLFSFNNSKFIPFKEYSKTLKAFALGGV